MTMVKKNIARLLMTMYVIVEAVELKIKFIQGIWNKTTLSLWLKI